MVKFIVQNNRGNQVFVDVNLEKENDTFLHDQKKIARTVVARNSSNILILWPYELWYYDSYVRTINLHNSRCRANF